ncbi:MAG: WD40 repeat domain-containing protein [Variibacter sp.]|nr:WD40 repeat domain-containing protein [Variibacter sp.]
MSVEPPPIPSIAEKIRPVATDAPVIGAHFLGGTAAFVLAEEAVLLADGDGASRRATPHRGGILASAASAEHVVTGGDDGQVALTNAKGETRIAATDAKRRWIDQVAVGAGGALAWSAGKQAFTLTPAGETRSVDLPSSAGGLAFAPKGLRLAIAHYGGASLWFPNASAKPEFLEWKGSHLGVTFSPDGKFLVTAMQEPMLHGWRLVDAKHMRMSGYAAKVRALSWTRDGEWLATSGADQLILWPFQGKDGPMGKTPKMLAPRDQRVAAVACHPAQDVAAVGYADGMVLLVRLSDGAEILARAPDDSPIATLAWSPKGDRLAFGTEGGAAGILVL